MGTGTEAYWVSFTLGLELGKHTLRHVWRSYRFNNLDEMDQLPKNLQTTKIHWIWNCCCCSVTQSCRTLCDPVDYSTPSFPVLHHLLELAQTHDCWVGDASHHLILCHPLLLLPSIFSSIRVFSNEPTLRISGQSTGASASASVLQWLFRVNFL